MTFLSKWDQRFLDLANYIAEKWSKDPNRKVGAILVSPSKHQNVFGYNGFPKGIEDKPERLENRDTKNAMTVHAEVNAILNARCNVEGWTMYVTAPPCVDCCKVIIQAGISRIVMPELDKNSQWFESYQFGLNLLYESGLQIVRDSILNKSEYANQGLNNNVVTDESQKVLENQEVTDNIICLHPHDYLIKEDKTCTYHCLKCNKDTGISF